MDVKFTWRRVVVLALIAWVCFTALERVFGQSMRRDSLTAEIMGQINLSPTGSDKVTPGVVWRLINSGVLDVCTNADAYEGIDTVTFTKGDLAKSLHPSFLRPKWMFHMFGDSLYFPMRAKSFDTLFTALGGVDGALMKIDDKDNPRYFFFTGRRVMVMPRYNRPAEFTDTFIVLGNRRAPILQADADTLVIHPGYRQAVIDFACWKLEEMRSNYDSAEEYRKDYMLRVGVQGGSAGGQQ